MAAKLSFWSGGGPDESANESLQRILGQLFSGVRARNPKLELDKSDTLITNKDIESLIQKYDRIHGLEKEDDLKRLRDGLTTSQSEEFRKVFPELYPGLQKALISTLMIGAWGFATSAKLRSRSRAQSEKVAAHDYIDGLHICFALHCLAFVTADKVAARKAKLLCDYWDINCTIVVLEKA